MTRAPRIDEIAELCSQETTTPDPDARAAAHARGAQQREDLKARLESEGAFDLSAKLDACGEPLPMTCVHCGARKSIEIRCKRRWCPACATLVMRERLRKYRRAAETLRWPLFVTLTIANDPDPERIRMLRESWGRFRRRKIMADKVRGGISTIEVTEGEGGWHPHLHILADCQWLALHCPAPHWSDSKEVIRQKCDHARLELSALWSQVVKQDQATVLATRREPGECLIYSLKYAVKGSDLIESRQPIAPLIRVLSKSRMLSAFGELHGLQLGEEEDERPACACTECQQEGTYLPDYVLDAIIRNK